MLESALRIVNVGRDANRAQSCLIDRGPDAEESVRKSIATVCLSGTLGEKLEAIAAARFDALEMFENDLIYCRDSPRAIAAMAADLGLGIDLYQFFRDFEGVPDAVFRRNLDRAERKFDTMEGLNCSTRSTASKRPSS